jgi:DNA-binding Lrp family transcriptional regulator
MTSQLSDVETRVLAVLQEGFPESWNPYKDMAERAGIDTEQFISILENWKRQGKLRRIGAIVNHLKVGFSTGAMVAWQVEPERIERVGVILAGFKEVSHAYERRTTENWPYNIYAMVHGKSIQDIEQIVMRMSRACGITAYRILATEKELKKVPPKYITKSEFTE